MRAILSAVVFTSLAASLLHSPAHAETPSWFTCPDSSEFRWRQAHEPGALDARAHEPSAGAVTSADLAAHARLSVMSYAMYDAFVAGLDPLDELAANLRPIALIYGDPGFDQRHNRQRARDTRTFYGVVADDPSTNRRLIVLRGTLQPNEWLRNLQARLRPFLRSQFRRRFPSGARRFRNRARVHNGFLQIFSSLETTRIADGARQPLADTLEELVAGREVTFVGHSLGGALATLAGVDAARLSRADAQDMRVVTFASPRVGNKGFAALAQAVGRIDRVCNVVDLVPAVPPSTRLAPYVHVGKVFRISSFDWPELENWHKRPGKQVTCWHSISAYAFMTDPAKTTKTLEDCTRAN